MINVRDKATYKAWNIAIILALVLGGLFLRGYIPIMIVAVIAAFIFNPIHQRFLGWRNNPGLAASLTFLVSLLAIIIPVVLVSLVTYLQIKHLLTTLSTNPSLSPDTLGKSALSFINSILAHIPGAHPITAADLNKAVNEVITKFATNLLSIITSSIGSIPGLITSFIIYIYLFVNLLMHQDKLVDTIRRLNPLGGVMNDTYLRKMGSMTKAMTLGQFIIATLQGVESAVVLYIVGFHSLFLFFAFFLSFLSLIPLGAGIVTLPIGGVLILTGNIWQGALVIANHLLVVTNIDNVIRPKLVPKTASLNSALTILSVFAGVNVFGFMGIIVGPVIMIVIVTTIQTYMELRSPVQPKAKAK